MTRMPPAFGAALAITLVMAPVTLSRADLPASSAPAASPDPLVGKLLVASPDLGDPRFAHTVILIVQHNSQGALGITINRPLGDAPVSALLDAIGEHEPNASGSVPVFSGGPVEPSAGFVIHSAEYHRARTVDIDGRVAMTATPDVLRDIGHHAGPRQSLVAFGYAGWGPGQLEGELALHGWFTIAEEPKLIFDDDRGKVWDEARARQTFPL